MVEALDAESHAERAQEARLEDSSPIEERPSFIRLPETPLWREDSS